MTEFNELVDRQSFDRVDPMFLQCWSPRALTKQEIPKGDLEVMIDAARLSPSTCNEQPWRFYISTSHSYDQYLDLLLDSNKGWAERAGVLGFLVCKKQFTHDDQENTHAVFDSGGAWLALTLQANKMGYHTRSIGGIHYDKVYDFFGLNRNEYQVITGFAIGVSAEEDPEAQHQQDEEALRIPLEQVWPTMED